jgi:hypothetical protein
MEVNKLPFDLHYVPLFTLFCYYYYQPPPPHHHHELYLHFHTVSHSMEDDLIDNAFFTVITGVAA